jgi:hypothetical protein
MPSPSCDAAGLIDFMYDHAGVRKVKQQSADSDEAVHAFQHEGVHPFRDEAVHRSDLKPSGWRCPCGSAG